MIKTLNIILLKTLSCFYYSISLVSESSKKQPGYIYRLNHKLKNMYISFFSTHIYIDCSPKHNASMLISNTFLPLGVGSTLCAKVSYKHLSDFAK